MQSAGARQRHFRMPLSQASLTYNEHCSNQSKSARWPHWLTFSLTVAAGFALRMAHLNSKPFWFDECFSAELAKLNWNTFLRVLWWREANMTIYYLVLRLWIQLGQSEFFIRTLSALLAAATVPAVYWLTKLLYDRRVALLASALFAFNAYSVRYAQEARSYALFAFLATMSSAFLVAWLQQPSRRNRVAYILISILAVYAHLYALLLVAAHWITIRGFGSPNGQDAKLPQIRGAWRIVGLAALPLIVFVAKTGAGPIRWIARPGVRELFVFAEQFAGSNHWPLLALYLSACIAAVVPVWKFLSSRSQRWETWRVQFLLVWFLFPILLTVVLSVARPVFLGRYMIFCLPAFVILAAAGLARIGQAWLLPSVLMSFLLLATLGVVFIYSHDFDEERDGSGAATDFILNHAQPGDGVIFDIAEARLPYEFFRSLRAGQNTASPAFTSQLGPEILFPHSGEKLEFQDFKAKLTADSLRTAVPGHARVWVFLIYNETATRPDATTMLLAQMLPNWFPQTQRWQFPRVELRLYSKP